MTQADFIGTFLKRATIFFFKATGSSGRSGMGGRRGNEVILQYWFAYIIEDISNIKCKKQKATVVWIHPVSLRKTYVQTSQIQTWVRILGLWKYKCYTLYIAQRIKKEWVYIYGHGWEKGSYILFRRLIVSLELSDLHWWVNEEALNTLDIKC